MPIDKDGHYTRPAHPPRSQCHPLMPNEELLRKLLRVTIASRVVLHEVETHRGKTERMQRALASLIVWTAQPDVVHWVESMRARGAIEPEFLS